MPLALANTNGAAGPNHYVETVNLDYAVFNKTGTLLLGPNPIRSIFSGFGGPCETADQSDPIVKYDQMADRWLITLMAVAMNVPDAPIKLDLAA